MKNRNWLYLSLLLSAFVFYSSCNKDCKKNDETCVYGTCVDGYCECSEGYEGDKCDIEMGRKFLGRYNVGYSYDLVLGDTLPATQCILRVEEVEGKEIIFRPEYLFNSSFPFVGTMTESKAFKIEAQSWGMYMIQGSGKMLNSETGNRTIQISFFADNLNQTVNNCQLVLTEVN
jgi:hypothetical protein